MYNSSPRLPERTLNLFEGDPLLKHAMRNRWNGGETCFFKAVGEFAYFLAKAARSLSGTSGAAVTLWHKVPQARTDSQRAALRAGAKAAALEVLIETLPALKNAAARLVALINWAVASVEAEADSIHGKGVPLSRSKSLPNKGVPRPAGQMFADAGEVGPD